MFSIISTCKNRLEHLKQTLPNFVKLPNAEIIVVDFGCQQGTSEWVKENFPNVKVITVNGDPRFNLACARNIGVKAASFENLVFLDADSIISTELGEWLAHEIEPKTAFITNEKPELAGFLACKKQDFTAAGSYDEAFIFWGGEDIELKERLHKLGVIFKDLKPKLIDTIEHEDDTRVFHDKPEFNNRLMSGLRNRTYRQIKYDVTSLVLKPLPLEQRKKLMQSINSSLENMITNKLKSTTIELELGSNSKLTKEGVIKRKLSYTIKNVF